MTAIHLLIDGQLTVYQDHLVPTLNLGDQLTVVACVRAEEPCAESMQILAAQWQLAESFNAFSACDAGTTDGLACKGYMGGVFDGRYIYFAPNRDGNERQSVHGRVLRYDTHGQFQDPQSYAAFDVERVTPLRTVNYYGAAFDGRYVYFSPQDEGHQYHSRVLRYDTGRSFNDPTSWSVHDLGMIHSHQGIACDGRYIYFPPGYEGTVAYDAIREDKHSGKVVRYDTRGEFRDPQNWQSFDSKILSDRLCNFDGGTYDGRYIYFTPLSNGVVLRYDTRGEFADPQNWHHYDIGRFQQGGWYVGAIHDGRFVYFVSYAHGTIVRCDTLGAFENHVSWTAYDARGTAGLDTGGFDGGVGDGRYIYFIPWTNPQGRHHANWLRYDTLGDFADPQSWTAYDASSTDGIKTIGYNGGAFDGRFLYAAPVCDDEAFHGRILRYDTLAEGAFALKYGDCGHNGGLCAAVPGPGFIVNTDQGPRSISAHRTLNPGWHHIVGTYDGREIRLYVDGELAAVRDSAGRIQRSAAPLSVGHFAGGGATFSGAIDEIHIADTAYGADAIAGAFGDLIGRSGPR